MRPDPRLAFVNLTAGYKEYQQIRRAHWDRLVQTGADQTGWGGTYHRLLDDVYRFIIPPGQRILELGCGTGDLLAALRPSRGVGVDFSGEMVALARRRHPELAFQEGDVHEFALEETFDVIIASDLINDLWDVQQVLGRALAHAHGRTRFVINSYSRLWELPLSLAGRWGFARQRLIQNWLTVEDIHNLLTLAGMELVRHWEEVLWPLPTPLWAPLCNRVLVRLWPFHHLALTHFFLARPAPGSFPPPAEPTVSVVVPARNEAGNIPAIFDRLPNMGAGTELILAEGHSTDGTYEAMEQEAARHAGRNCLLMRQPGTGKGDAVRAAFDRARGDILMILDADLTVAPEDLPRFFEALVSGKGEFINGVRLVYPLEDQAMRFFNFLGNKFFSLAFSWLLGQPVKDTLCGTKVLWKRDYDNLAANRSYFGDFDPFGDFDLIFGAAKMGLKIVDLPIRYRQRTYGTTNIQRWRHGWLLLKMVALAAGKIKFV